MREFCQEWGSFASLKFDVFKAVAQPQEEDCGDDRKEAITRCHIKVSEICWIPCEGTFAQRFPTPRKAVHGQVFVQDDDIPQGFKILESGDPILERVQLRNLNIIII